MRPSGSNTLVKSEGTSVAIDGDASFAIRDGVFSDSAGMGEGFTRLDDRDLVAFVWDDPATPETDSQIMYHLGPADISHVVVYPIPNQTYTGFAIRPEVMLEKRGTTLEEGVDYALSYRNNIDAGTATVTIRGIGSYSDITSTTFEIVPASIEHAVIGSIPSQTYTGSEVMPAVTVTLGNKTLTEGTDYTASYADNVEIGTGTVTVTGEGNLTGSASATFQIVEVLDPDPSDPSGEIPDYSVPVFEDVYTSDRPSPTGKVTAHADDIVWLASEGISTGWTTDDGTSVFRPMNEITRADTAAFLFRLAKQAGMVDDSWAPTESASFSDVTTKTSHFREIMWLAETEISQGWTLDSGKREFRPNDTVKRSDIAAFLHRLDGLR